MRYLEALIILIVFCAVIGGLFGILYVLIEYVGMWSVVLFALFAGVVSIAEELKESK